MEWIWCVAIYAGYLWGTARCVSVRVPPSIPSTVEAQAKFFQDFFSVQLSPYKIEFGHVCEDPNTWEQRYEKKDFKNHRDMGKVRWGDKKGGYGEHYWDLNHAGHNNDHDDGYGDHGDHDDGSYHEDNHDPYDEPSEDSPTYGNNYDPEKASYEDSGRTKRAHPKVKVDRHDEPNKRNREVQSATKIDEGKKPRQYKTHEDVEENDEKKQVVLVVSHKDKDSNEQETQFVPKQQDHEPSSFVPYENGAGIRQHQHVEATVAASVPRLFLEASTGHVVDRATGQAYVLQPITNRYN